MRGTAPLIARDDDDVLFRWDHGAVRVRGFLADVRRVAAGLPAGAFVMNQCQDRYAFAVAFAAGLVAGRTALLNVGPERIGAVQAEYAGASVVADPDVARLLGRALGALPADDPAGGAGGEVPWIDCAHVAAIVFTSGSTGAPVAHVKPWGSLVQRSRAAAVAFGMAGGCAGGLVLGMVPPQHMYGFETTVLLPLHAGVSSWCGTAFYPGDVAAVQAAGCVLVTTPLQIRMLLGSGVRLAVTAVISATAPLDPALAGAAEAAWGVPVMEIFGATECGSIAWRRTVAGPEWQSYPGVSIAFDDAGAVVSTAEMGPVRLADVLEPAAGGFRLVGRRTDLVKLGGRRASLPGLERLLLGVAGVEDGAFVVPDEADARLVAVVVAPGRTGAEILADLRRVVEPVFVPRRVIQVERLPRNTLGKLPREALLALVTGS